ncbi:maltase A1-like [Centruroides vittatus]|uniref:maltase A1-like n=1 Tax=Centruroides vittatus TaxID=120091 RepID=UPI00350E9A2F
MRKKLETQFFWLELRKDIQQYCERCEKCSMRKRTEKWTQQPLQKFSELSCPFQRIGMDILGPLPTTAKGNKYVLVFLDHFSRYAECAVIPDQKAVGQSLDPVSSRSFLLVLLWYCLDWTALSRLLSCVCSDTLNNTLLYYGEEDKPLSNILFNFKLLELTKQSTAKDLLEHLEYWTSSLPDWACPNWVFGNHDVDRLSSRVGEEVLDGIFMATLLNRGTPIIHYGDELGILNARILPTELKDVVNPDKPRDVCRTPMQWNNSTSAGFSNSTNLWLPIQDDFETVNVENELQTSRSHLNVFRELVKLRSQPAIRFGKVYYLSEKPNMFCKE